MKNPASKANPSRKTVHERASAPSIKATDLPHEDLLRRMTSLQSVVDKASKKGGQKNLDTDFQLTLSEVQSLVAYNRTTEKILMALESRLGSLTDIVEGSPDNLVLFGNSAIELRLLNDPGDCLYNASAVSRHVAAITRCIRLVEGLPRIELAGHPVGLIYDALTGVELLSSLVTLLLGKTDIGKREETARGDLSEREVW